MTQLAAVACAAALSLAAAVPARAQSEVPEGTRFLVELRNKLEARKVRPGKKFEVRTLDTMQASDGTYIRSWTKIRGRVTHATDKELILRLERIELPGEKAPIIATATGVVGEKDIKSQAGDEGEIKSQSHRGRDAAIGAAVVGGLGAAIGGAKGGGKGAAIGAGAGAATGAVIGASAGGGKDLVLQKGTRIEFQLDRPLVFRTRR